MLPHHTIVGRSTEVLLFAGNGLTLFLTIFPALIGGLQLMGLLAGLIASCLLGVNEYMKITWKIKQRKLNKDASTPPAEKEEETL